MRNSVELKIVAQGVAPLTVDELAAVRKDSVPNLPVTLSPQLLRHSDEQTLAALVALSIAYESTRDLPASFNNWAVISSSQNLGQGAFAKVIDKYQVEGPWGVSVQVIPHCTAHAVAGTASLALASHGPCIGVGGCVAGQVDAFISAASMLNRLDVGGVWLLFSTSLPRLAIDSPGQATADSTCMASAIAIMRESCGTSAGRIRIGPRFMRSERTRRDQAMQAMGHDLLAVLCENEEALTWSNPETSALRVEVELFGKRSLVESGSPFWSA